MCKAHYYSKVPYTFDSKKAKFFFVYFTTLRGKYIT